MPESVWNVRPADAGEVERIAEALGLPAALARVLWLRGLRTPEAVEGFMAARESLAWLDEPLRSPGMEKAVARIRRAIEANEPFVIYGDYDCDGVTSTSLLYRYLKRGLGANCEAYLPDRFKDGYGVTAAAVERIADRGIKLILTCDNGISAVPAAEAAKRRGVEIVVTDHHQPPEVLPDVHAIVHPALGFPHLRDLAGVGVALLFVVALEGRFSERLAHFLDIACIGTVGDVVPLDGPNRSLVWAGLERYRAGKHRFPGLGALAEVARTDLTALRAEDVAFQLVPRLNAAGRLETPDVGFRLLTTNDKAEAATHARALDAINRQRKDLSAELQAEIFARIDAEWDLGAEPFIVLADSTFHHGITGIIAGRVKDRYRVPVLLFSGHGEDAWKASGRSPEGLHLYEALHAARRHLIGFGGHAQAAGCAALPGEIPAVRAVLNRHVREVGWSRPPDMVVLDAELPFAEANGALIEALDRLEPFGQRNPAPVFGLLRARVVGRRIVKTHLFLNLDDGERVREVIAWGRADQADALGGWVRLTYKPRWDTWNGDTRVQLVADRLEPAPPPSPLELRRPARLAATALADRRGEKLVPQAEAWCYGLAAMGERAIGPLDAVPASCGELVLLDPPRDEQTFRLLAARAERLTLAWSPDEPGEPALEPGWLPAFWQALAAREESSLTQALAATGHAGDWRAYDALDVFREAGILVERPGFWQLLAPPDDPIALGGLASFRAAADAAEFRRQLRHMPLERLQALLAAPKATA